MLTYGLDTFNIGSAIPLNNALTAIITKHYPQNIELGAMALEGTLDRLAQKMDALEDGRSGGFLIHPGIEADTLEALFSHGMARKVKLVDGSLRRGD